MRRRDGADRGADGELPVTRGGPCQHEVRHVHAGDEQHESDDAQHRQHDRPQLSDAGPGSSGSRTAVRATSSACCRSFDIERPIASISLRACASVTPGFSLPMQRKEFDPSP